MHEYKQLVKSGYDQCAQDYAAARCKQTEPALDLLFERLAPGARVLDIGCGNGVPVAQLLAERYQVTGVDISDVQIALARANVPRAVFVCSDIMAFPLGARSWDAIVSMYALFHLPKDEQVLLINRMGQAVSRGGCVLCTVSIRDEDGYTEADFFGTTMYWSNFALEKYNQLFVDAGFTILHCGILNHGYADDYQGAVEKHPLLLAEKQ